MGRVLVFGDEAGDFNFTQKPGSSRYFIVTTVTLRDDAVCHALLDLRRDLMWEGSLTRSHFHGHADTYATKERVYGVLANHDFRVDSIILEKARARGRIREDNLRFWKSAWYFLLRHVAPRVAPSASDELFVVAALVETRINRRELREALADVVGQTAVTSRTNSEIWRATDDVGLQIADYCSWAIQRRWERGNEDAYRLIRSHIASEHRLF